MLGKWVHLKTDLNTMGSYGCVNVMMMVFMIMMTISMKLPNTYAEVDDYHGLWLSDAMKEEVFEVRSNVIF